VQAGAFHAAADPEGVSQTVAPGASEVGPSGEEIMKG